MPKPFVERFRNYLIYLTHVMRLAASVSSIFPNPSDNGQIKEHIFLDFLKQHIPNSCNVLLGGFLFNLDGDDTYLRKVLLC
jgi:hypothetical protein